MRKLYLFIFGLLSFMNSVHGASFPFTDVKTSDPYYNAVYELYNGGVIINTGDNLFRPNDLMNRDFYVSLTVGVGCKKCAIPSAEDIFNYQIQPFIDVPKITPYYYCISYAKDVDIVQGYRLNNAGQVTCENKKNYTSTPFCPENTITRIEAAAVLLRRANLWNDTLNTSKFERSLSIPDADTYWYGYAKKSIEAGIIKQRSDGTVGKDEKITRGEFAIMAQKILRYTQCQLDSNINNTIEGAIGIKDLRGNLLQKSTFENNEPFILIPITSPGEWKYSWKVQNPDTGEILRGVGDIFPSSRLSPGTWTAFLDIIDPLTNEIVSRPYTTLQIGPISVDYSGKIGIKDVNNTLREDNIFTLKDRINLINIGDTGGVNVEWKAEERSTGKIVTHIGETLPGDMLFPGDWTVTRTAGDTDIRQFTLIDTLGENIKGAGDNLSVHISANPLVSYIGGNIDFTAYVSGASDSSIYQWIFGDTTTSNAQNTVSHTYNTPGIYNVSLTVTDPVTQITRQAGLIIEVTGEKDSDKDKVFDASDMCPFVSGNGTDGCPTIATIDYRKLIDELLIREVDGDGDRDEDGVSDLLDNCVNIPGPLSNKGCPNTASILDDIKRNACIREKLQTEGLIFGSPVCTTCPCSRSLELVASLRECDIVFPTILSPDGKNIYSRGSFYTIQ